MVGQNATPTDAAKTFFGGLIKGGKITKCESHGRHTLYVFEGSDDRWNSVYFTIN
jgi:hypothetical protein